MSTTTNVYHFRLYPDKNQEQFFQQTIGCTRKIYNLILADRKNVYEQYKNDQITKEQHSEIVKKLLPSAYKNKFTYLKEVDSTALASSERNLVKAYNNFFEGRSKFPNFKKKNKTKKSFTSQNTNNALRIMNGNSLKLPKLKTPVKIKIHRGVHGRIRSATITQKPSGKWFASLSVEPWDNLQQEYSHKGEAVGIDLGLKDFATLSTGQVVPNQQFFRTLEDNLVKEQRVLSRRYEQFKKDKKTNPELKLGDRKNYQKQRLRVALVHEKIKECREDFLHKLSHSLVRDNDFIAVETLTPSTLAKTRMSKSVSDVAWGEFVRQLEYKSLKHDRVLVKIDKYYPSTQLCNKCNAKTGPSGLKGLSVRSWECSRCSTVHDRDVNAANNILDHAINSFL